MQATSKKLTISFCTLCMNRLHHVKQTLPQNIQDTLNYPESSFILLDYNSTDGLENWVKENLNDHLISGKLIYYKYEDASYFHRSHSRNLAFKAATGELICNVDADNYIGSGFAHYINEQFSNNKNIFLTTIDLFKKNKNYHVSNDVLGRLCIWKKDFLKVQGYDERMTSYGFEDYDMANRLEMLGLERVLIQGEDFLKFIPHNAEERYSLKNLNEGIKSFYISYKTPWESSILVLFEDQTFSLATIINNSTINADDACYAYTERQFLFEQGLKENKWHTGLWEYLVPAKINFQFQDGRNITLDIINENIIDHNEQDLFYEINNESLINRLATIYLMSKNRAVMEQNLHEKKVKVNNGNFGSGKLINSFNSVQLNLA